MSEAPVLEEYDDGVLLLTLNRPAKKNAFNDPQWDGLRDAYIRAREDDSVACVVVTGAGQDFSSGTLAGLNVLNTYSSLTSVSIRFLVCSSTS